MLAAERLWDLPPVETVKRRGRKQVYQVYREHRLPLTRRAAHRHGWVETLCTVSGAEVVKRTQTFLATHATFGGTIRVVIVKESTGPQFFFCTDGNASVREIIECFADRSAFKQVFHDVTVVWGIGQHQTCNLWANIAMWPLNLWLHTLTELWAWTRSANELVTGRTHRGTTPCAARDQPAVGARPTAAKPCRPPACNTHSHALRLVANSPGNGKLSCNACCASPSSNRYFTESAAFSNRPISRCERLRRDVVTFIESAILVMSSQQCQSDTSLRPAVAGGPVASGVGRL